MALNLDANAQRVLDLAKRAVPADGELDFSLLMAALCHGTALKDRLPADLAERLPVVPAGEGTVPDTVAMAIDLQPVIRSLKEQGRRLNPELLFKALLDSPAGQKYLHDLGVATNDLRALSEEAGQERSRGSRLARHDRKAGGDGSAGFLRPHADGRGFAGPRGDGMDKAIASCSHP